MFGIGGVVGLPDGSYWGPSGCAALRWMRAMALGTCVCAAPAARLRAQGVPVLVVLYLTLLVYPLTRSGCVRGWDLSTVQ